jgi:uncharacterized membrane protein
MRTAVGTSPPFLRRLRTGDGIEAMADGRPYLARGPIAIARHPIYALFLPVPIVGFAGAFLTDWAYQRSGGNLLWLNFSNWLITAGLAVGALAGLIMLIEIIRLRERPLTLAFLLMLAAWIVELFNALVHQRDGWTAVVPTGFTLSIIGALLVLIAGWLWRGAIEARR